MEINHQKLPKSRLSFTVKLTNQEVDGYFNQALEKLASLVKLPGFRPGNVPLELASDQIEPDKLREEAYSFAVRDAWIKILKDLKEKPIHDPEVEVGVFEKGKDSQLEFTFDYKPAVKLKDYKKITLTTPENPAPVEDKNVDEVINSLRKGSATTVITAKPAEVNSKIEITFEGKINNQTVQNLSAKNFPVVIGDKAVIPGFEEELIGLKKGDKKTFKLPFPKEHFDKELSEKEVTFDVIVEDVFDVFLPEMTDEFAKKFGKDTVKSLRESIKEELENRNKTENNTKRKAEWLAQFEKLVDVEIPESLIKAEVERSEVSWREFLAERTLNPEEWLKSRGTNLEKMREDWHKASISTITVGLGVAEIANSINHELKNNEDFQKVLELLVSEAKTKK